MDQPKFFVLDTSVVIHDPEALFTFEEHTVAIPAMVFQEIDKLKVGVSDVAHNARRFSRLINQLVSDKSPAEIRTGVSLGDGLGSLFFEALPPLDERPHTGGVSDDSILFAAIKWAREAEAHVRVIVVSKDINLRIQAKLQGLEAEDYHNDRVVSDVKVIGTGFIELPEEAMEVRWVKDKYVGTIVAPDSIVWPNAGFALDGQNYIVRSVSSGVVHFESVQSYTKYNVYGINALNKGQTYALNALMNPSIDLVALLGAAGTGKTLLALAAGLALVQEERRHREILVTRAPVPLGNDIGFLPGTEKEKMTPWMGAVKDNLEFLLNPHGDHEDRGASAMQLIERIISMPAMTFMRGRTLIDRFVIIDEAQNLTVKQTRAMLTRAGKNTKVVLLGNLSQIDTPYIDETSSGLTWAVRKLQGWPHGAYYTLTKGERSRLAHYFES